MNMEQSIDSWTLGILLGKAFTAQDRRNDLRLMSRIQIEMGDAIGAKDLARKAVKQHKLMRVCEKWAAIASDNVSKRQLRELREKTRKA